jgi:hypothetical protein
MVAATQRVYSRTFRREPIGDGDGQRAVSAILARCALQQHTIRILAADNHIGAYGCPGKNLAEMSLRTSLSMIAQNFDVFFAPGETGETFDNEMLDTFTVTLPPLQLQFFARSRK